MSRGWALAIALLLGGCGGGEGGPVAPAPPVVQPPAPPPVSTLDVSWLQANAHPIRTAVPDDDFGDLEPLRAMIGDARVVALGEQTHGTREFYQMKHRILRFLAREMGFTTFAIEAPWAEAAGLDQFVTSGAGDPAVALRDLGFWIYNTREVLDMVLWMREWNAGEGRSLPIRFHAIDLQNSRLAMDEVVRFVQEADPGSLLEVAGMYACFRPWQDRVGAVTPEYGGAPEATRAACRASVRAAHDWLAARRAALTAASSPARFERVLQAARVVVQNEESRSGADLGTRDRLMAENAEWVLGQAGPGARMVVWAHNYHVSNTIRAFNSPFVIPGGSMGRHLRESLGDDLVIAGFAFNSGTVTAVELQGSTRLSIAPLPMPPAPVTSHEHQLSRLGIPRLFVDLRAAPESWLRAPQPFRGIGWGFDPGRTDQYFSLTPLPTEYDLMFFWETTTGSERM